MVVNVIPNVLIPRFLNLGKFQVKWGKVPYLDS